MTKEEKKKCEKLMEYGIRKGKEAQEEFAETEGGSESSFRTEKSRPALWGNSGNRASSRFFGIST